MKIEKFTQKAQEAIMESQDIAIFMGHQAIDTEHLHLALLRQEGGLIPRLYRYMDVDVDEVKEELERKLEKLPKVEGSETLYGTRRFNKTLLDGEKQAEKFGDMYVSVEHIYIAILEEGDGVSGKILKKINLTRDKFVKALKDVRGDRKVTGQNPEDQYEALEKYGRDLVEMAREGKLDPVIGRDEEIRHTIQILSRRTKNNPVLIGKPGVFFPKGRHRTRWYGKIRFVVPHSLFSRPESCGS